MSGVIKSIEALNAVSRATGTYDFVSYANFYNTGNVKGLQLIKSTGKTLGTTGTWGEIIPYTGNVTGGASKGVSAINFSSQSAGSLTASRSGALISIPAVQLVGAILAGLGLGIVAYEANPALWVEVSNKIFSIIPGYEPITEDEIPYLSFTTLFKNGKTHVPDYLLEHSANVLNDLGAYSTNLIIAEGNALPVGETVVVNGTGFSKDLLIKCINKANQFYTLPETRVNPIDYIPEIIDSLITEYESSPFIKNKHLSGAEAIFGDYFNYCIVEVNYYGTNTADTNIVVTLFNLLDNECVVEGEVYKTIYGNKTQLLNADESLNKWIAYADENNIVRGCVLQTNLSYEGEDEPARVYHATAGTNNNALNGPQNIRNLHYGFYPDATFNNVLNFCSLNTYAIKTGGLNGVKILEGAIVPSSFPMSLPDSFPEWWASRIGWSNLNPEIQTNPLANPFIDFGYMPLAVPNANPLTVPVETPQPVIQAGEVPATNPEPVVEGTQPVIDNIDDKELPTGGGGDTPAVPVIPPLGGTATALYTVYNPTKEQLNQLGAYLWSEDALSILQQLFQNPLESVIGLHILYATPATGESRNIKLGYLNSGVSAKEVTNQYINIDCGSIVVPEYFGDARDYSPYTQVNVFLPFIGIRQLDTNEVMGGTMSIDYKIDVLTGTCLCMINVSKLGYSQVLYTFEGNCAVQLPLTGADKSRLLTGVIGGAFAGSVIGGTGGAVVGAVKGAIGGIKIQKTGSIGSNAGAMGIKKPYIIITRQKPYDAYNYNEQYGYPANMTVQLSSCTGFTRVKDVHVENILVATQEEKDMIQTLLRQGVIIE